MDIVQGCARHPVHPDSIAIRELGAWCDAGFGESLPLGVPMMCVATGATVSRYSKGFPKFCLYSGLQNG